MIEWARVHAPRVNIERETLSFRHHEYDKPKSDWLRTWKAWMLNAEKWWKPDAGTTETPRERSAREFVERAAPHLAAVGEAINGAAAPEAIDLRASFRRIGNAE